MRRDLFVGIPTSYYICIRDSMAKLQVNTISCFIFQGCREIEVYRIQSFSICVQGLIKLYGLLEIKGNKIFYICEENLNYLDIFHIRFSS